jgi:imidazole glycerol-phosphate synthase subunit HisF
MTHHKRIIPCLLIKNSGLVKTQKFRKPKYVGDPINAIRIFNEKEVDELIVLDIEASTKNKKPNFALIEELASECFMPLCYGGGVKTFQDAQTLFNLGIEKVAIQSAVSTDPGLITKIAENYGEQAVVASVDIKKNWLSMNKLHSYAGKKFVSDTWQQHVQELVRLGAGEILFNSVDNDGVREGMNLALIDEASKLVGVPLTAIGGVGSLDDIKDAIDAGASAVAVGSFFVFQGPHRAVLITYPNPDEIKKLWSKK